MPRDTLAWARDYNRRGWQLVPVPAGKKRPIIRGWNRLRLSAADLPESFGAAENIAVILGAQSGELADIDLDCIEALDLADLYLPETEAVYGRPTRPRSHRLFIAVGACYEAFADPVSGEMLVELRTDGRSATNGELGRHLSLLPPSVADGEQREWHGDVIAPTVVDGPALRLSAARLSVGCLVMRYVSEHAARRPGPGLSGLLWELDHELGRAAYRWLGKPDPDAPRHHPRPRAALSHLDLDLAEVVHAIPNDCSWKEWNDTGMAIYAASGGSEDGFIVFDDWSAKSPKYRPHVVLERWRNYGRSPPSRIGFGTLVYRARHAGWRRLRSP